MALILQFCCFLLLWQHLQTQVSSLRLTTRPESYMHQLGIVKVLIKVNIINEVIMLFDWIFNRKEFCPFLYLTQNSALLCCAFSNVFAPTLLSPDVALAKLAVSLHRGVIGLRQGCQRSGDQVRVRILASRHLPTSQTIPHKQASLAPEHLMIIKVLFLTSDLCDFLSDFWLCHIL